MKKRTIALLMILTMTLTGCSTSLSNLQNQAGKEEDAQGKHSGLAQKNKEDKTEESEEKSEELIEETTETEETTFHMRIMSFL